MKFDINKYIEVVTLASLMMMTIALTVAFVVLCWKAVTA